MLVYQLIKHQGRVAQVVDIPARRNIAAEKEVLAVPRDALILRREGASVFKVLADDTVKQVNVITGLGAGSHIEVIGDLTPGDRIVIRGAERLSDGMTVSISGGASVDLGDAANP